MNHKDVTIVVSGDICINSLQWITHPQNNEGLNWQTHMNMHNLLKPGEALLLAKIINLATDMPVCSPKISYIESDLPREFLRSNVTLDLFPVSANEKDKNKVYRIKEFMGFTGPSSGKPKLLPIQKDNENADIVVIDDDNNGFNSNEEFWPLAIKSCEKEPIILYKMNNPISSSKLWKHLEEFHMENTIIVINANDLRSKGVNISKGLSWERTSQDFVWQINNNPNLAFLAKCHHLIVPFGLEGAIYYRNDGVEPESRLYFLPYEFEGGFVKDTQGKMYGLTSCFVAGLSRSIVASKKHKNKKLSHWLGKGIREGIVAAQKYFIEGFGKNMEEVPFPKDSIFVEGENDFIYKEYIQDVKIPNSSDINGYSRWYILEEKSTANLAEIAYDIVKNGERKVLKFIPSARFGKLKTVDRTEIESYRSIKNLMWEYISTSNTVRPLSISVFGTPGSGKSFGIMEIAASIAPNLIKALNFNLSQFHTLSELSNAFHKVRDLSLEGKIPLVFFDEFDSTFEGNLGWLKYFLAPMQDGAFREGDAIHPIGKAIFVFAGGTSSTFKEFCGEDITDEEEQKQFRKSFKSAKGPDFISRLRGYVNILGPNQVNGKLDQLFIIRRAMLLRSLLERKEPHLINEKGEAQIDNGVLRALLKIPRYKHESRSMEAILEMSMLTQAKKWEQSHLPSREQLKLHVDEDQFLRHLMHDAFFSEKIESLAKAIHEKYIRLNKDNKNIDTDFIAPWDELSEDLKSSNLDYAKHIPGALLKINYDVVSVKETPKFSLFTESELDILANYEHTRWCLHRKENGWTCGDIKDMKKKTDPALVPWDLLPDNKKHKVHQMVKIWPEILSNANFKIEPLKFSSDNG
ncbi:RyR domain-containing protein [Crassaminicella profunda]|uniref:RyR domain-containing protein n=1 Tax=Crassaminicella profunda TaxID=1286698 RepID=UPI001CA603D2|nr:RyR domain-containing protein [Crassaminicella profunda]QZY54961.1 Ryanodine receptor Ryr [Crassaminicella profunda]